MRQTANYDTDCTRFGTNICLNGSSFLLYHLCLEAAKTGKRVKTLNVSPGDWGTFGGDVARHLGTFEFRGDRGCICVAPAGYKVEVFVDPKLGPTEWSWLEEPVGE